MKKLYIITAVVLFAASIQAAQLIYQFPDAGKMKDTDRVYVYQNASGNRNLTGSQFKYEALGGDNPMVKQAFSGMSSQWAGPNSIHRRISEIRNAAGNIIYYITAAGRMNIGGQPVPFAVTGISPANGTTDIFNNYSVRACAFTTCSTMTGVYWNQKKWTGTKYVQYNKYVKSPSSTTDQFIVGKTLGLTSTDNFKYTFADYSVAAATTYTMKVWLENFRKYQTDGEYTATCPGMTDTGDGYCESTFTTR